MLFSLEMAQYVPESGPEAKQGSLSAIKRFGRPLDTTGHTTIRVSRRTRWALSVLDRVVARVRAEFLLRRRPEHFEKLKVFLLGQSEAPYASGPRDEHLGRSAQSGHSPASQEVS